MIMEFDSLFIMVKKLFTMFINICLKLLFNCPGTCTHERSVKINGMKKSCTFVIALANLRPFKHCIIALFMYCDIYLVTSSFLVY